MENRYEKFVLEAEEGIAFKVSEGITGELIIRAVLKNSNETISNEHPTLPEVSLGEYATVLSVYTDQDGNKAVIPAGWTVSGTRGENTIWGKNKSLVIYRIPKEKVSTINWSNSYEIDNLKRMYDQLVWVPVSLLASNGTTEGSLFTEKFSSPTHGINEFSESECNETLTVELVRQLESVKKYGGFYISRYNISESADGKPRSIKGRKPWVNIDFDTAKKVAAAMEDNDAVKSHLPFGIEYDSVLDWFIKSGAKTRYEITENSKDWGNYWNTANSPKEIAETGSCVEWCVNNLYDLAGNIEEWTQEHKASSYCITRGGSFDHLGIFSPVAHRNSHTPAEYCSKIGFRAILYIK